MEVELVEMKSSKETIEWLFFLAIYGVLLATHYILRSVFHLGHKDLIYRLTLMSVLIVASFGYLLYLWRADLSGFFKRVFAAIPFALFFGAFMIILTKTFVAAVFALTVYFFLLYKTANWKQHFSITLILASILAVTLKFSYAILYALIPQEMSIFWSLFPISCIVFFGFSYGLYLRKAQDEEAVDLRAIFLRILKFTAVFILFFSAFLVLVHLRMRNLISFLIGFSISVILGIIFLLIVYSFNLMPIERKNKTKKKSKLDELKSQLNDFYIEEREKSSGDQIHL